MYFISVIATFVILFLFTFGGIGVGTLRYFFDLPSLCLLILVCIPILASCGLMGSFFSAFRLAAAGGGAFSRLQKERAREAVALAMKTLLVTGGLVTVYSLIMILRTDYSNELAGGSVICAMISVSFISLFYSLILALLLLPMHEKIKLMLLEDGGAEK